MVQGVERETRLVFQRAAMLAAAKTGGAAINRFLHLLGVFKEFAIGIVIGPFALGGVDRTRSQTAPQGA